MFLSEAQRYLETSVRTLTEPAEVRAWKQKTKDLQAKLSSFKAQIREKKTQEERAVVVNGGQLDEKKDFRNMNLQDAMGYGAKLVDDTGQHINSIQVELAGANETMEKAAVQVKAQTDQVSILLVLFVHFSAPAALSLLSLLFLCFSFVKFLFSVDLSFG